MFCILHFLLDTFLLLCCVYIQCLFFGGIGVWTLIAQWNSAVWIFQVHCTETDDSWQLQNAVPNTKLSRRGRGGRRSVQQKPFPCTRCSKSFGVKSHLTRHMQLHTGQYSFYCELCRRGFNERGNFEAHMNKHKGRSFPCQYCTKRYSDERFLKMHMRESHSDQLEWGQNLFDLVWNFSFCSLTKRGRVAVCRV